MKFKAIALLLLAATPAFAGSNNEARFTRFTYTGNDTYYNNNPLENTHEFYNPVISGWASDPSVCRVDSDYYLVTSTFGYFPGVPIHHSRDLVNWQQIGNVLDRQSQVPALQGQSLDKGGVYAPTIRYNPFNKTFYVITSDEVKGNFYVTAKNPEGPWSGSVYLPKVQGIDPSFFFDDDGKAYIIHKEVTEGKPKWNNHRSIQIIRFDTETGQTVGENVPFNEEGVGEEEMLDRDEGPHIYKIDGKYYVVCAEGGTSVNHSAVCYRADSVFGPYRRWARNPMLTQRTLKENRQYPVSCAGHADLVQTPGGDWWAVFLATRPWNDGFENLGRETFLMPVKWSKDGFPYMTQGGDTVPLRFTMPNATRNDNCNIGNFTWTDDFSANKLRPEWLMLWGDASAFYKLPSLKGKKKDKEPGLKLHCRPYTFTEAKTPAFIGRRIQHHQFTVDADMEFEPNNGGTAGLMLVKNNMCQIYLSRDSAGATAWQCYKGKRQRLGSAAIPAQSKDITLRVTSDGKTFSFFAKAGKGGWLTVAKDVDARFLSTRSASGFTGTTIGMYAEE